MYSQKYLYNNLNDGFVVDLTNFIGRSGIDCWIHGHHHFNHGGFKIGNTKIVTNQLGYFRYNEHENFAWNQVIEI